MAFKLAEAFVQLSMRSAQFTRELGGIKRQTQSAAAELGSAMGALGLSFGAGALIAGMVNAGSASEEMSSKFNAVFKELSAETDEWARSFATRVGRGVGETKKSLAEFQDVLKPLGFANQEAQGMSMTLQELALDMASFNNQTDEFSTEAIRKALTGEREMLKGLGIVITEADVKQRMLEKGQKGLTGSALKMAKAQATLELIMQNGTDALGDATRTAGSFANRMKGLQGAVKDLGAAIGGSFLPELSKLVHLATRTIRVFTDLNAQYDGLPARIAMATAAVMGLVAANKALVAVNLNLMKVLKLAFAATPWGAAIVAVGALIAGIIELGRWLASTTQVQEAWAGLTAKLRQAWERLAPVLTQIRDTVLNLISQTNGWLAQWGLDWETLTQKAIDFAVGVVDWIAQMVQDISEWMVVIYENWDTVMELMSVRNQKFWIMLRDIWFEWPEVMAWVAGRAVRALYDAFNFIVEFTIALIEALGKAIMNFMEYVWKNIKSMFTGKRVEGLFEGMMAAAMKKVQDVGKAMVAGFEKQPLLESIEFSDKFKELAQEEKRLLSRLMGAKQQQEALTDAKLLNEAAMAAMKVGIGMMQGAILTDARERAAAEAKKPIQITLPEGFIGFEAASRKVQEQLLKSGKNNEEKMVGALEAGNMQRNKQLEVLQKVADNTAGMKGVGVAGA